MGEREPWEARERLADGLAVLARDEQTSTKPLATAQQMPAGGGWQSTP
jgi:hypothetical protein